MIFFKVFIIFVFILFVEARYLRRHYMDDEIFGDDGLNFRNKDEKNILTLPRERNETDNDNFYYSKKLQIHFVLYLEYNEGKMQCMSTSKPNTICILNITVSHDEEYQ